VQFIARTGVSLICHKTYDLRGGVWQIGHMTPFSVCSHAKSLSAVGWLIVMATLSVNATNYDEDKVGTYTLPDPLVCNDGSRVTNAETWFAKRRPEILEAYRAEIFGRSPDAATNAASPSFVRV
jgi:hypothetical protein